MFNRVSARCCHRNEERIERNVSFTASTTTRKKHVPRLEERRFHSYGYYFSKARIWGVVKPVEISAA